MNRSTAGTRWLGNDLWRLLVAMCLIATTLVMAPASAQAQGASCVGGIYNDAGTAKSNYEQDCGQPFEETPDFRCDWVPGGWQCSGPGSATTAEPKNSPAEPKPEPVVEKTEAPVTKTPIVNENGDCVGGIYPDGGTAKANFEKDCGQPFKETPDFRCDWVPGGWQCTGPGSNNGTPNEPKEPETEEPGIVTEPTDSEGTVSVSTLRELRDSGLPNWVVGDALSDQGFSHLVGSTKRGATTVNWAGLPASELDKPFEAAYGFDLEAIQKNTERGADSPIILKGVCSKEWVPDKKHFNISALRGDDAFSSPAAKVKTGNLSASVQSAADIDGSISITGTIYYQKRQRKCLNIPYRWEFLYAEVDIIAEIDGSMEVDNTFTIQYKERLWEHVLHLLPERKLPLATIANVITVNATFGIDLTLALDLEATASFTQTGVVNQDYLVDGEYKSFLRCDSDGCESRKRGDSSIKFTTAERNDTTYQRTLDVILTPSADLQLKVGVRVGILGHYERLIWEGYAGLLLEMPMRIYWTEGNACSDVNGDGVNEHVSILLVDITVQLSSYTEQRYGGYKLRNWIELNVPLGWLKKIAVDAATKTKTKPIIVTNLLMKVVDVGENSPLEMVINNAGKFEANNKLVEGIEIGGVRECYPFAENPQFEVDWGDGTKSRHVLLSRQAMYAYHDWADDGRNRTVKVRIVNDNSGRYINGPWVSVDIDGNSNLVLPEVEVPNLLLSAGASGPELSWTESANALGYNIYRDGNYADTVRNATSWSLQNEDGQEHSYTVVAFDDTRNEFSAQSNAVVYGGGEVGVGNKPKAIVSLGDSFISGEGGRWSGNSKSNVNAANETDRGRAVYSAGRCHRSDVAPVQSAAIKGLVPINLACSGAESKHVRNTTFKGQPAQVEALGEAAGNYDVEMIVLSIGGNDLGFGDILQGCMSGYALNGHKCRDNDIYSKIVKDLMPVVEDTIEDIEASMEAAGDTDYRLVLQSYVSPIPRSSEMRYNPDRDIHINDDRVKNGCGFYNGDLDWARDTLVPILDNQYRILADKMDIEFLSLRDAFQGKEVCAKGTQHASGTQLASNPTVANSLEWIRWGTAEGAIAGDIAELLHPNALGQQALGRCLSLTWERNWTETHTCRRTGNTPADMQVVNP